MKRTIDQKVLMSLLEKAGFPATSARQLQGGSNHIVFAVTSREHEQRIVKFAHTRSTEQKYQQEQRDTLFDGPLSLSREAFLMDRIRQAGVPTPKVFGIFASPYGDFILMEHAQGLNLPDYMASKDHRLSSFLKIMSSLGQDMKRLHQTCYPSFGDILKDDQIHPQDINNFADRYLTINRRIITICQDKGGLSHSEAEQVERFFTERFEAFRPVLSAAVHAPTLVITDLHGDNFFIQNDRVSSYFDVESAQAAPGEFELYGLRFFVFNFYGQEEFLLAEKAFWHAYTGGQADSPDAQTSQLIDFFSACRLLEIFQSYWDIKDGIRDRWGVRIKGILFDYMQSANIDYQYLGRIWRERDGQPKHAVDDRD